MNCELQQSRGDYPNIVSLDHGRLRISFHRTIRVPETDKEFHLPPSFGTFPLYSVKQFEKRLPESMSLKGGLFFPIHQKEAMWIRFESRSQFAVKIYVGGVNAISGEPSTENMATKLRRQKRYSESKSLQDYIVTPAQLWVDGIAIAPGKVRQFVAVASGQGFTVEAQVTGEEVVNGLQFEVTKAGTPMSVTYLETTKVVQVDLKDNVPLFLKTFEREFGLAEGSGSGLEVRGVPKSIPSLARGGIRPGGEITVQPKPQREGASEGNDDIINISIKTLTGATLRIPISRFATIQHLKSIVTNKMGISKDGQRLIHNGHQLDDDYYVHEYGIKEESVIHLILRLRGGGQASPGIPDVAGMGIAAGGKIKQSIHQDRHDPGSWDRSSMTTFNVQTLNAAVFEKMIGISPPPCPIDATTYLQYGLPFFELPEHKSPVQGEFQGVQSLSEISTKGKEPAFQYPECWEEHAVVQLNPDGSRMQFRTVSELEQEIRASNAA
ncbi:hypothetical protein AJ78_03965 [Emergomyces pasteurianus Ep9510]|uniref:Ubiquitin-like domain-containing protein n=1 Tax=Emergomyces pasteurianus Ep9510 TaxID=1447872 RepID=A0A1J9PIH7_9EURO|nr:hypothetical protein AJ78_03965 [Emergomyces pasteurianus Ep9510]